MPFFIFPVSNMLATWFAENFCIDFVFSLLTVCTIVHISIVHHSGDARVMTVIFELLCWYSFYAGSWEVELVRQDLCRCVALYQFSYVTCIFLQEYCENCREASSMIKYIFLYIAVYNVCFCLNKLCGFIKLFFKLYLLISIDILTQGILYRRYLQVKMNRTFSSISQLSKY